MPSDEQSRPPAEKSTSTDAPAELQLSDTSYETMVEAALEGAPREVCGILGGAFGPDRSQVYSVYPATNVADQPRTRYRIDPEEQLEIFDRLESNGEEIVGFYHSHPRGPSEPSETDIETATWPDRSYVIVFPGPESGGKLESTVEQTESGVAALRSWRWHDEMGRFEQERLGVLNDFV